MIGHTTYLFASSWSFGQHSAYGFSFDTLGLLTRDQNPAGGFKSLSRTEIPNGFQVTLTTAGEAHGGRGQR
jgi:hypothetical protein